VFEKAAKMFSEFIKDNFDISDEKIKHKVIHTYNVVKMAEYISKDLDLSEEDRTLSRIVALLPCVFNSYLLWFAIAVFMIKS